MPYAYKSIGNGQYEVYKKDTGKKVGITTKTNLKKYIAALYMHAKGK